MREGETEKEKKEEKKTASANKKMIFKHSATFPSFDSFKCKSERKWKGRKKKQTPPAKNTQFTDRQMTSRCHLISFLA